MKHTREYRNSGKTRTPMEPSKDFFLCGRAKGGGKILTDNSPSTVPYRVKTWKTQTQGRKRNLQVRTQTGDVTKQIQVSCSNTLCTRLQGDLCHVLKRDKLSYSCCWIRVILLKTSTSEPRYRNSWQPVCSSKVSGGFLSRKHLSEPLITEPLSWVQALSGLLIT